jgi:MarR family transcriptional regulator, 2-MHQ and catechol-resistance regulon repressor
MDSTHEKELSLKLFVVLTRALQSITSQVKDDITSYGLNTTEFAVLELLYNKGEQPIQRIGDKVLLASSSITYVVDKLEKKELITRKPCENDRRVTFAVITEAGKSLMDEIFPKHVEAINGICAGLDAEEKQVVIEKLKKLGTFADELK